MAERLEGVWPAMRQAAETVAAAKAEWLLQWERSAVKLATAIAARVIRREVTHNPEITLAVIVRESLELAAGSTRIQLRLHPDDLTQLGGFISRFRARSWRQPARPRLLPMPQSSRADAAWRLRWARSTSNLPLNLPASKKNLDSEHACPAPSMIYRACFRASCRRPSKVESSARWDWRRRWQIFRRRWRRCVEIERLAAPAVRGEVIGFRDDATLVYLTGDATGIRRGNRVPLDWHRPHDSPGA